MGQLIYIANGAGGGSSSGPLRAIIWRPGGVTAGDVVTTWAEVETHIVATQGSLLVSVDTSLAPAQIPAIADTECFGRLTLAPLTSNIASGPTVEILDGGRLRNLFTVRGNLGLTGTPTVNPFLLQDVAGSILVFREGARLVLDIGATVSAVHFAATFCEIATFEGGSLLNSSGNPALSLVQIDPGLTALHAIISQAGTTGFPGYDANTFTGDATTVLIQIYDSSAAPVPQPNFLGFILGVPMSFADGTVYKDTTTTPTTGATTVQALLDILKRRVTGFGTTAGRPAIPADIDTGGIYFDTDLGIPIWSNGVAFVDAAGALV